MGDELGRPYLDDAALQRLREAFLVIPEGKRGALILIADTSDKTARAHLAARLNGTWRVAAGGGFAWDTKKPSGWIGVEAAW